MGIRERKDLLLLPEEVRWLIVVPSLLVQVSLLVLDRNLLRESERWKWNRVSERRI